MNNINTKFETGDTPGDVVVTLVDETSQHSWSKPGEIGAPLHPVMPFDPGALLPESLRGFVLDEANRMPCPPDFVGMALVSALGAVIGTSCAMKAKVRDDWLIVANLWGAVIGPPAAKKSPAIGAGMRPLDKLVSRAMDTYKEEMKAHEVERLVFDSRTEALEANLKKEAKKLDKGNPESVVADLQRHKDQAPVKPMLRRHKTNDATPEKLGELLAESGRCLLVLRDEIAGLLSSWDKEGREGERAYFLEAWNGNSSYEIDRIKRGSLFIENLCLSVFGGMQPDKLIGYLERATHSQANDGLLQRFQLLVYPDDRDWEWRDMAPSKEIRDKVVSIFEEIADFDPIAWGAAPADNFTKFPHFYFDSGAQEIFIEWSTDLHRVRLPAEDNPLIAQHLAKYDKLFPALALILHLVECADKGISGPVRVESAEHAVLWCEYLESHARRCYGLLADDGLRAAQALSAKVKQGKLEHGFTARDVRRHQWRFLTTGDAVQSALDWLEEEHWLYGVESGGAGPGTGRPTVRYFINPELIKQAVAT